MKKILSIFLSFLILIIYPLSAFAVGEDDPLWSGHPSYEKKVMNVGNKILIANNIHKRLTFLVIRDYNKSQINAYANDTGDVVVYYSLLKYIESDDELAAILSHEISHQVLHHNSRSYYRRIGMKVVLIPLFLANAVFLPIVPTYLLLKPSAKLADNAFTRKQEYEADSMGMDLMVKAGYNPLAMESIISKISGDGDLWEMGRGHPMGTNRIAAIHKLIVTKYPQFLEVVTSTEAKPVNDKNIKPVNNNIGK